MKKNKHGAEKRHSADTKDGQCKKRPYRSLDDPEIGFLDFSTIQVSFVVGEVANSNTIAIFFHTTN